MRGNDVPDRWPLNPVNSWFANVPAAYPFYLVPIWHQVVLHFAQKGYLPARSRQIKRFVVWSPPPRHFAVPVRSDRHRDLEGLETPTG